MSHPLSARTVLRPVPLAPELSIFQAAAEVSLLDLAGGELRGGQPLPFWAFAWAGGQALARHVLDHPDLVAGRRVVDVATGSGVAALAASRAGAAEVVALDVDPAAAQAVRRNADANELDVVADVWDVADGPVPSADVVLAGDVFYTGGTATRMAAALRAAHSAGARVLVGDPGRGFLPQRLFAPLARYPVPVPVALEEADTIVTTVWEMRLTPATRRL